MFLSNKSIVGLNYLANVRFSAASETNVPKSPKNRTYLLGPVPACKYISIYMNNHMISSIFTCNYLGLKVFKTLVLILVRGLHSWLSKITTMMMHHVSVSILRQITKIITQ